MRARSYKVAPKLLGTTLTVTSIFWAAWLIASPDGVTGLSKSPNGCYCHSSSANTSVTVAIAGPQTVAPGSTSTYTISVSGGPVGYGGFDLSTDGGTLTAGTGSKVSSGELVNSNPDYRAWTFTWEAPATTGTNHFYAVAIATDGSGMGDSWNWYGGAPATPFNINVSSTTPTRRQTWGALKTKYR